MIPGEPPNIRTPGQSRVTWEREGQVRSTLSAYGEASLDAELAAERMRADALWAECRALIAENAALRGRLDLAYFR